MPSFDESSLNAAIERVENWLNRLQFYRDLSYLNEEQVIYELETIRSQLKTAKRYAYTANESD